ncbi:MAG: uroporphyrinogen-III synthase [Pseudomonadota bacterium]
MKVLITRAIGPAQLTANHLSAAGHEAVLLPIVEYNNLLPSEADGEILSRYFEGIAFTSVAAVHALKARIPEPTVLNRLRELPAFCVGGKTGEAAREAGFGKCHVAEGNIASLAVLINSAFDGETDNTRRILYPAPRHKHENLADLLDKLIVDELTVYEARLVDPGRQKLKSTLNDVADGAAFFYSRRTASHFFSLMQKHELRALPKKMRIVAISQNVADIVRQSAQISGNQVIAVPNTPHEEGMISCLSTFE